MAPSSSIPSNPLRIVVLFLLVMIMIYNAQLGIYSIDCRLGMLSDGQDSTTVSTTTSTTTVMPPPRTGFPLPRNTSKSALAVFVLSRRDAFDVRQAVRDTWAAGHDNVYFVIGQSCTIPTRYRGVDEGGNSWCQVIPKVVDHTAYFAATVDHLAREDNITRLISMEQQQNHDILLMQPTETADSHVDLVSTENNNIIDMYRTLPQKIKTAYQFVAQHLPHVQYTLKVDDDFYVRISRFERRLIKDLPKNLPEQNTAQLPVVISGNIFRGAKVHTDGKWKEVPQYPANKKYPTFPLGSYGHVVSRPIAEYVAQYSASLLNYQGEDVSLGIWLDVHLQNPVPNMSTTKWILWDKYMTNKGNCINGQMDVIGHGITPAKMRECYHRDQTRAR